MMELLKKQLNWLPENFYNNLASLFSIQAANFLLPWLSIPYLVRVIGPDKYGMIAFATAVNQYFMIITEYGFNFTVPREIALRREDRDQLQNYASDIYWSRVLLMSVALVMLIFLCWLVPQFNEYRILLILTFGMVIGNALLPICIFQGMEQLAQIARVIVAFRFMASVCIFVFIQTESDYFYVPMIHSASYIFTGLLITLIFLGRAGIRIRRPKISGIVKELKNGFQVFLSSGAIAIYVTSNTVILGFFVPSNVVGWYAAGEKLVRALQEPVNHVCNLLYPAISRIANSSRKKGFATIRRALVLMTTPMIVISAILIIMPSLPVQLLFGSGFTESARVVRILGLLPLIMSVVFVYANLFLLGFGYLKYWSKMIMAAGIVNILCNVFLVGVFSLGLIGTSIALLLTETTVLIFAFGKYIMERRAEYC